MQLFPDIQFEIVHSIEDDDSIALHAKVTGTHAETNRLVCIYGTSIARVRDGKIVEIFETWDFATMLAQIGVLSEELLPFSSAKASGFAEA